MSLAGLFESQDAWFEGCVHDPEELRDAGVGGELAALLAEVVPWAEGDLMMHPREGRGIVVAVKTTMYVQVEFASGNKTLAHKGW